QLKPLGKQAEIARRAAGIQADLRDARLRLLADDLWSLRGSLRKEVADEEAVRARRADAEAEHARVTARLRQLGQELAADPQAASDEIARVSGALAEAHERLDTAQQELEAAESDAEGIDSGDADLDARLAAVRDELATVETRAKELTDAERAAEREAASFKAREEALALSLTRKDGAGALLTAGDRLPGVLGSVAALLSVDPGHETAIAAALGPYADAV